jgi:hypothetical protein
LEKFLAAKVLEVRVLHPALAQNLVGKVISVLEDASKNCSLNRDVECSSVGTIFCS